MGKKKKARKRAQSKPALSQEEHSLVSSLIESIGQHSPEELTAKIPTPQIAAALVDRLPAGDDHVIQLAQAVVKAFPDKVVQKSVRKFLFKLKTKGIDVPQLGAKDKGGLVLTPPKREEPKAYIGNYDPFWIKPVIVALPRVPKGFDVGISGIDEKRGLIDFDWSFFSKKTWKELEQDLKEEQRYQMVETTLDHALWLLESAYQASRDKKSQACEQYARFKRYADVEISPPKKHPVYDLIEDQSIPEQGLIRSQLEKLFQDTFFMAPFYIKPEEIKPLADKLRGLDHSPIIMPSSEVGAREEKIKLEWLSERYPPEERQRLKHTLEETAFVLFKIGREEEARIALVCAREVVNDLSLFQGNLFLEYLLEISIDLYEEFEEATREEKLIDTVEQESPLIIKP